MYMYICTCVVSCVHSQRRGLSPLSNLEFHAMLEGVETERQEGVPPVLLVSVGVQDGEDVVVMATVEVVGLTYKLSSIP